MDKTQDFDQMKAALDSDIAQWTAYLQKEVYGREARMKELANKGEEGSDEYVQLKEGWHSASTEYQRQRSLLSIRHADLRNRIKPVAAVQPTSHPLSKGPSDAPSELTPKPLLLSAPPNYSIDTPSVGTTPANSPVKQLRFINESSLRNPLLPTSNNIQHPDQSCTAAAIGTPTRPPHTMTPPSPSLRSGHLKVQPGSHQPISSHPSAPIQAADANTISAIQDSRHAKEEVLGRAIDALRSDMSSLKLSLESWRVSFDTAIASAIETSRQGSVASEMMRTCTKSCTDSLDALTAALKANYSSDEPLASFLRDLPPRLRGFNSLVLRLPSPASEDERSFRTGLVHLSVMLEQVFKAIQEPSLISNFKSAAGCDSRTMEHEGPPDVTANLETPLSNKAVPKTNAAVERSENPRTTVAASSHHLDEIKEEDEINLPTASKSQPEEIDEVQNHPEITGIREEREDDEADAEGARPAKKRKRAESTAKPKSSPTRSASAPKSSRGRGRGASVPVVSEGMTRGGKTGVGRQTKNSRRTSNQEELSGNQDTAAA